MLKLIIAIACLSLINSKLLAQIKLENWRTYTAFNSIVSSGTDSENRIWAISQSGAFFNDKSKDTFQIFRNVDALLSLNLSAIYNDKKNKVIYIGALDGTLEILTEDLQWTHNLDIKNSGITNTRISKILEYNGKVYIAGGFGLAVFDPQRKVFIEDVKRLGNFPNLTKVIDFEIQKDTIYVATTLGLAKAKIEETIADKAQWINIIDEFKLPVPDLKALIQSGDSLLIMCNDLIFSYKNGTLRQILNRFLENNEIGVGFVKVEDRILYYTNNGVFELNKTRVNLINFNFGLNHVLVVENDYYLSTTNNGLINYNIQTNKQTQVAPDAPTSNIFIDMKIDSKSNLWVATSAEGNGVLKYDGSKWKTYNVQKYPEMRTNAAIKIDVLKDERIVIGTYGAGQIFLLDKGNFVDIKNYNNTNSTFIGLPSIPDYIIIGNTIEDNFGNLWTPNWIHDPSGGLLVVNTKDGFKSVKHCESDSKNAYFTLEIDQAGTKWLASSIARFTRPGSLATTGLYYYNERGTFDNKQDDVCGTLTEVNYPNMKTSGQNFIKLDKNGYLWIARENGVSVILNPTTALSQKPNFIVREIRAMRDLNVRYIMVDALNNKWFATSKGVYVLNEDGSEIITIINTENSPLTSNDIYSIISNENTGDVYIGTMNGLTVVNTLSVKPKEEYALNCYPAPFKPKRDEVMFIDGLAAESDIKIMTLDGLLIKSLKGIGRTIIWDGKKENGEEVSSGIYLVIASTNNGEGGVAKFTVIRD
jgi:ligand-binding sensor domain-containing protein